MLTQSNKLLAYVALVALAGAACIAHAISSSAEASDPAATAAYVVLALMASALKLRIPGMEGTISPGFVSVLTGVALMTLAETVLVVTLMALVQMYWSSAKRPQLLQAVFNVGVLAASSWVAFGTAQAVAPESVVLRVALAVAPLYLLNAGAVAAVLSLAAEGNLKHIWNRFQLTLFPYYLVGAVLASLISLTARTQPQAVLLLPLCGLVYMTFVSYKAVVPRVTA